MKNKGSITIYLSIILVSVILLISIISESGRVNAVQTKSKSYTYMAAESVLAEYGKQIYSDYGVLLVWENEPTEDKLKKYIQDNINMADLNGSGTNFMTTEIVNVDINNREYVTDKGGEKFTEQIISYMKYAGTVETVNNLIKKFKGYSGSSQSEVPEKNDVTHIVDNSDELQKLVKDINGIVTDLKDSSELNKKIDTVSQKFEILKHEVLSKTNNDNHDTTVRAFLKKYRELITELDMEAGNVDSAIDLIKQYERKKELFLEENGYTSGAGDYIDDNLKILENIGNKIIENKALDISNFSDVDSKNIDIVIESVEKILAIRNKMQSLHIAQASEEDKKNQSIYESASAFLTSGILSLVIDDVSDISNNTISSTNLPSLLKTENLNSSILKTVKNKAILSLYAKMKFGNYISLREETCLKYELEYIINGENSDKANLTKTIEKIVAVRNVANYAYLVTDKEKMKEISLISASAATAIGLPFLEPLIKGVLLEAWALAEAVCDTKELLKGEKIPLIKNKENWNTSLTNLLKNNVNHYEGKKGLNYEEYLEILILLGDSYNCVYRIMDLIQINVQKKYNNEFLMAKCFQSLDITAKFKTEQLFTAMPWVVRSFSENRGAYEYDIKCICNY